MKRAKKKATRLPAMSPDELSCPFAQEHYTPTEKVESRMLGGYYGFLTLMLLYGAAIFVAGV